MMVHNIVRGTYYIEEQGYKGSAFYKITSAEMKRIEGFASKDTKVIKGVVLLQSLPGYKVGSEGNKLPNGEWGWGKFTFTEKDLSDGTFFKVSYVEKVTYKNGDLVVLVNHNNHTYKDAVGSMGRITGYADSPERMTVNINDELWYGENVRPATEAEIQSYSRVIVSGYTPNKTRTGIAYGCNDHSNAQLRAYRHFLSVNNRARMSLNGTNITIDMIDRLLTLK